MSVITYDAFIANVQEGHLNLLASFSAGTRVRVAETDTEQLALIRQQCIDLYQSELLSRVAEGYERVGVDTWRTFDGYVVDAAHGYVNKLATDRIKLSRDPLP